MFLGISPKFTGKHLYQSLFLNKVAGGLQFYQKETLAKVFSCELCEICKNTFLHRTLLVAASVFWKSVKPLFSDKSRIRDRISISENGETLKTDPETTETINSFFSNIVTGP